MTTTPREALDADAIVTDLSEVRFDVSHEGVQVRLVNEPAGALRQAQGRIASTPRVGLSTSVVVRDDPFVEMFDGSEHCPIPFVRPPSRSRWPPALTLFHLSLMGHERNPALDSRFPRRHQPYTEITVTDFPNPPQSQVS